MIDLNSIENWKQFSNYAHIVNTRVDCIKCCDYECKYRILPQHISMSFQSTMFKWMWAFRRNRISKFTNIIYSIFFEKNRKEKSGSEMCQWNSNPFAIFSQTNTICLWEKERVERLHLIGFKWITNGMPGKKYHKKSTVRYWSKIETLQQFFSECYIVHFARRRQQVKTVSAKWWSAVFSRPCRRRLEFLFHKSLINMERCIHFKWCGAQYRIMLTDYYG